MDFRKEKDNIGEMSVPADSLAGIHTYRARNNFRIDCPTFPSEVVYAIVEIKRCAAQVNTDEGFIAANKGAAIVAACDKVLAGFDRYLPDLTLPSIQGGAGTSVNMNVNEVIANLAVLELKGKPGDYSLCHPNDDVNKFQSTNDVFPTAVRIAAIRLLYRLAETLADLQTALQAKENEFADVLKPGRTEMQEAMPVTLGIEFGAYAEAVGRDRWRVFKSEERLRTVNLGGTAVGTGSGAPKVFIFKWIEELRKMTGLGISRSENSFETTQNADVFVEVSGILKAAAANLYKISADLRLLSSGPRSGLGEIKLPDLQAGSSIMPGKVNPVIPEFAASAAMQVYGNDQVISFAAASGQLELNAFLPLIAANLISSLKILTDAARALDVLCIRGIAANPENCTSHLEASDAFAPLLVPYLGYDQTAELVKKAHTDGITVRESVVKSGLLTAEELEIIFHSKKVVSPGISGADVLKDKIRLK